MLEILKTTGTHDAPKISETIEVSQISQMVVYGNGQTHLAFADKNNNSFTLITDEPNCVLALQEANKAENAAVTITNSDTTSYIKVIYS